MPAFLVQAVVCSFLFPETFTSGGATELHLYRSGNDTPEVIKVSTEKYLYGAEADAVARGVEGKEEIYPAMTTEDTLALMRSLDRWRKEIGLSYDGE